MDLLVKDPAIPSTCFSRLWTCYERCFFAGRSRDIKRLYEVSQKGMWSGSAIYLASCAPRTNSLNCLLAYSIMGLWIIWESFLWKTVPIVTWTFTLETYYSPSSAFAVCLQICVHSASMKLAPQLQTTLHFWLLASQFKACGLTLIHTAHSSALAVA